jgi:uncharacterized protein YbjQ (UPF0145 family)
VSQGGREVIVVTTEQIEGKRVAKTLAYGTAVVVE